MFCCSTSFKILLRYSSSTIYLCFCVSLWGPRFNPLNATIELMYWSSAIFMSASFLFMQLFQWFLSALSVLPSSYAEMIDHLLSTLRCSMKRTHSSSLVQLPFFIFGFKWLCHRSRHAFPSLVGRYSAIIVHLFGPTFSMSYSSTVSS